MKEKIKNCLLKIKYGYKATSASYEKYLKKLGIKIGNDVHFYSPWSIMIDTQRPWMIEIGNHVHITANCSILQHGYEWAVLKRKYGVVLGSSGKVKIGNNVFIGQKTTILRGVTIYDDIIIGANSLVSKDLKESGVYAGAPAKFICTLEEFKEKREKKQLDEATELVIEYKKRYGKFPKKEILREYFWLFEPRENQLCRTFDNVFDLVENREETIEKYKSTKPRFNGYDEFLKFVSKVEILNNAIS